MPTARELLEQADALMRRNRKRGKGPLDVPTLTDALGIDRDASLAPTLILPDAPAAGVDPIVLEAPRDEEASRPDTDPMPLDTLADVPVLTDAVLAWPAGAASIERAGERIEADTRDKGGNAGAGDAFPASAAEAEAIAATVSPPAVLEQEARELPRDDAPASPAAPPLDDDFILDLPPTQEAPPAAVVEDPPIPPVAGPPTLMPGSRDWDALAEEIRMQVLQRLDLFTDTGLREQLGARLSPIVDRASAALVETINRELGELVRGYVAEAIEREIESWRNRDS